MSTRQSYSSLLPWRSINSVRIWSIPTVLEPRNLIWRQSSSLYSLDSSDDSSSVISSFCSCVLSYGYELWLGLSICTVLSSNPSPLRCPSSSFLLILCSGDMDLVFVRRDDLSLPLTHSFSAGKLNLPISRILVSQIDVAANCIFLLFFWIYSYFCLWTLLPPIFIDLFSSEADDRWLFGSHSDLYCFLISNIC